MRNIDALAKILWDYNKLTHELVASDAIFVMGSNDIRVAARGVELWKDGLAPLIIFSGNRGRLTEDWDEPEAVIFANKAESLGVPKDKIIIERESTNTGENVKFTKDLLERSGVRVKSLIGVQKPFMGRRAYATIKALWPTVEVKMTSPNMSFDKYPNDIVTKEQIINHLVGGIYRIKVYAERGWQIPQAIPEQVWSAYLELVEAGYTNEINE